MIATLLVWALQTAPAVPVEPQDPDRPQVSLSDFSALADNNIFSPPRSKRSETTRREERRDRPSEPAKIRSKPPVVTGFIRDKAAAYHAIVEDRNESSLKIFNEPKFLGVADELRGFVVQSVEADKLVLRQGEKTFELKVGDSFPDGGVAEVTNPTPTPDGAAIEPKPAADEGAAQSILEQLKRKKKKRDSSESDER